MSVVGHNTFWSINEGPLLGLQVTAGGEGSSALLPGGGQIKKNKQTEKKEQKKNRIGGGVLGELQRGTVGARCSCGGLAALAAWVHVTLLR